jgi:hypothetical protein
MPLPKRTWTSTPLRRCPIPVSSRSKCGQNKNGKSMKPKSQPNRMSRTYTQRIVTGITWMALCSLLNCGGNEDTKDPPATPHDSGSDVESTDLAGDDMGAGADVEMNGDADNPSDQSAAADMGMDSSGGSDGGDMSGPRDQGGGPTDELYLPDNGPTHENGTIVGVGSAAEILDAIANAAPGDVITVRPGTYAFNQLIGVNNDGRDSARIFLRAESSGTVTLNLSHIENFKISAKFWIFENIRFVGDCTNGQGCEHAFHIVGDADDVIFRSNEVVNFASHVKLNGEVLGGGPAKSFPDRTLFIDNFWHNTRYVANNAPHNILNLDGGKDHVVRGNIFADYNTPESLPKSASAVYPKASTLRILIEQNLIVCEKSRTAGETARGIQLGDGAPASICDGDTDQDGSGDCIENGQSQESIVRNNIIMNCNNGGSATGIMVGSDRESKIYHNTVYNVGQRNAGFHVGHPDHDTFWRSNILENGFNTNYAERPLDEMNNITPSGDEMNAMFRAPGDGNFFLEQSADVEDQAQTHREVAHDFCGYPRGPRADRGAIEYSTDYAGTPCSRVVKQMYDRIPD